MKAGVHARVCGGVMACQGEGETLAELLEKEIRLCVANHITVGLWHEVQTHVYTVPPFFFKINLSDYCGLHYSNMNSRSANCACVSTEITQS